MGADDLPEDARELLKLAAIASGYELADASDSPWRSAAIIIDAGDGKFCVPWNPRRSDRDAFELATRLQMTITISAKLAQVSCHGGEISVVQEAKPDARDKLAHARFAIVRAAAIVGLRMQSLDSPQPKTDRKP